MVQGCDCKLNPKRQFPRQISTASLLLLCAARSERISIRVIVLAFARNSLGTAASRGYFTKKVSPGLVLRICRKFTRRNCEIYVFRSHALQSRRADAN